MRLAICDDDRLCREALEGLLEQYKEEHYKLLSIHSYNSAAMLADDVQHSGGYDIYILDVLMPGLNGIELGMQLRKQDRNCRIFYLSSSRDYAVDAFNVKASDYLIKPVDRDELFPLLDEAILHFSERAGKSIIIKTKYSSIKLSLENVQYAALEGKTVVYHLINGDTLEGVGIRTAFAEAVQELLQDKRFMLCGTSMAVNLSHVSAVESEALIFRNGKKLFISKRAGRELRSGWTDFWFEENCQ